ncbi:hypothetical protein CCUS01_16007 [Colletotrichum cuscutae]|uniref:RNase H type-1 domain-containing protein n=1 Tax=Colletotrichum cuscutae TaxID=1209917 RepID=A0AAI9VBW9_9PEZI|nr:hypothetical protein CCUS01_16007 [Colletotrichum cuscutae]
MEVHENIAQPSSSIGLESPTLTPNPPVQDHTATSTGTTASPSLTFKGDLIILPNPLARISPTCASIADPSQHTLRLFADASFPGHNWHKGPSTPSAPAGAAVFWKPWPCIDPADPWHSRAFQILACHNPCQAELFAVVAALETATLLAHLMPDLRWVTVFSDCQDVMNTLAAAEGSYPSALDPLVKRAFEACGSLRDERDIRVAVCWCPGHVGILGNEKADELSKEIRRYNFRHLVPEEQPTRVSGPTRARHQGVEDTGRDSNSSLRSLVILSEVGGSTKKHTVIGLTLWKSPQLLKPPQLRNPQLVAPSADVPICVDM